MRVSFPPTPAVLLATCLLAACSNDAAPPEQPRLVRTQQVAAPLTDVSATYSGEIRARREAEIGFMVSGRIQQRRVEVGDRVEVGTSLFQLDTSDAVLNANASRSQVESARSQLVQAQSDARRYEELARINYVSKADLEKANLSLRTAEQSLRSAQANHGVAANQAGYTHLRSTVAGVVTAIEAEAGQVVEAGRPVVRIAEQGEREVVVSVPESRVQELRDATSLRIELWAEPGRQYAGRLRELAPDTDAVTRTYSARISLLDADPAVRLGMTAKVRVLLPATAGVRRLPLTAVHDLSGRPGVWIVNPATRRVSKRTVTLAGAQKDSVLVSQGLRDGDLVVTAGVNLLHEGQPVRLATATAGAAP